MVELIAIVRRNRAAATKQELARIGCLGYFQFPVAGRGRQRGLRDQDSDAGLRFLPKVLFDLIVDDERAAETIEAIIRANQTGQFGDGRIFVLETEQTYRISTGAREAERVTEVTG
jgi:nitrogen regulatory protein PII 2